MGLFDFLGAPNTEDAKMQEMQEASARQIEAGGLPLNAVARLQENAARQNTPEHLWTSDLSVSELLLVEHAGFQPLGQVMGSSVYHVGIQWRSATWSNSYWRTGGASQELDTLTQAFYNARHLALNRLAQEAALLGATAVTGVRLKHEKTGWGGGMLEFSAIGTAIREDDVKVAPDAHSLPPLRRPGSAEHISSSAAPRLCLSDLSAQDFWKLRVAGFRPVGIAVGNCTYYTIPTWNTQNITSGGLFNSRSWQNIELPDYTQALYAARELAMGRMESEAQTVGARGIVGVTLDVDAETHEIEINNRTRVDMLFHFTAIGTAIAPFQRAQPLSIDMNLSMRRGASNDAIDLD